MKNFAKPLLFAVILLSLGGVAYWDEWQTKKESKAKEEENRLLSFKPDQIVKLDYTKIDEGRTVHVQMAKDGDLWKVLAPVAYPGDPDTVSRLMKTFEELRFEKSFEASEDKLKEFGLDQPKIKLTLSDKDGRETTIRIGAKSPTGYSSYAKVDESHQVYLVNHYAYTAGNKELFDFRDKSLRLPDTGPMKALSYQYRNEPLITLKAEGDAWMMQSPKRFKADAAAVKEFMGFFGNQRVARFMDEPSAAMKEALSGNKAGTNRLATLVLTGPNQELTQYAFMENGEDVYTSLPGYDGIIVLDKKIKEGLKKSLADFQDRAMFSFNATEATGVDLDGRIYVKKDGEWQSKDAGEKADFIRLLLVDFEFAKADAVLTKDEAASLMQGSPLHMTKFTFKDGKTLETSIWKIGGDTGHIAMKVGTEGFFRAPLSLLENFNAQSALSGKPGPGDQG